MDCIVSTGKSINEYGKYLSVSTPQSKTDYFYNLFMKHQQEHAMTEELKKSVNLEPEQATDLGRFTMDLIWQSLLAGKARAELSGIYQDEEDFISDAQAKFADTVPKDLSNGLVLSNEQSEQLKSVLTLVSNTGRLLHIIGDAIFALDQPVNPGDYDTAISECMGVLGNMIEANEV